QVYTTSVCLNGEMHRVVDDSGQSLIFRSQLAAKKPFRQLGITRTTLAHQSYYDEMVGSVPKAANLAVFPIASPDQDLS
ncbi:MAG: hypothetical protein KDI36_19275, partial [Pseudomonadales bacterium]|nr:hypothetical protein [Pseudomonadales bacterium]